MPIVSHSGALCLPYAKRMAEEWVTSVSKTVCNHTGENAPGFKPIEPVASWPSFVTSTFYISHSDFSSPCSVGKGNGGVRGGREL